MSEIILDNEEEIEIHTWDTAHEIDPNWDWDGEAHRGGTGYPSGAAIVWGLAAIVVGIATLAGAIMLIYYLW